MTTGAIMALLLASCTSDTPYASGRRVTFDASIGQETAVSTRAGITFDPVRSDHYKNLPFYLHAEVDSDQGIIHETAKYQVIPGMVGRLAAVGEEMLWYNKKDPHTFYAWTLPWQEDDQFKTEPGAESPISFLPATYREMTSLDEKDCINCGILERFVAAKTDPLSYNTNGELVELYFQHLVSKININVTKLIGGWVDGEGAEAVMTFLDMPQQGLFHRRPVDGRAPYVENNKENKAMGVTCDISNPETTLYVCPEIDFSQMRFAIHFNDGKGNRSDYSGDFKSVIFKRPDDELGQWDEDKKSTVLYAGEEMTVNLVMRNGVAQIFDANIKQWSEKTATGTSHAKQGVYTLTELQDIYNKFAGGGYSEADVKEVFDLFGVEVDGEKIIYLYEDLATTHGHFPLDPAFILDGLGHVLQMRNTSRKFPDGTTRSNCAQVPCCRNIFLTNGEHMIYIDENYHIWKVDPETLEMTDTEKELTPRPLPSGRKSYFIDYETGDTDTSSTV